MFVADRRPEGEIPVPAPVRRLAGSRPVRVVWRNELGGLTFEALEPGDRVFIKWTPPGSKQSLRAESDRLEWAASYTSVPAVVDYGQDEEEGEWLVTSALPGRSAVDDRWLGEPGPAVAAIGTGLRALHEALPVDDCPFEWSVTSRLSEAQGRAEAGDQSPSSWHHEHHSLTVSQALAVLARPPSIDHLVVCHGDACAPNTLLDDDGNWTGHVDLGHLGVGDRWADLAIATWSTAWNYGPGWEADLLEAYGANPDPERVAYYRLLWDLA